MISIIRVLHYSFGRFIQITCLVFFAICISSIQQVLAQSGSLDLSFDPGSGAPTYVWTTCVQPDRKILIGGNFTSYNGVAVNRIARLNSDGSLDATFNVGGSGASWDVKSIALQSDGKIIIAGWFTSYNGTSRKGIARLNSDGTLDSTFDPGIGANSDCNVAVIQNDGKILLGGAFSSYNGTARNRIVRINSNGSIDLSFNGCAGVDSYVYAIALQADGKILLGGQFITTYVCGAPPISVTRLIRLNSDGSYDSGFNPPTLNDVVYSILYQSDGKIIIGGQFSGALKRLNPNGSTDIFPPSGGGPGPLGNSGVMTMLQLPNSKIVISGSFSTYNSVARSNIAQLNADGTIDLAFNPGTGANQVIYASSLQPDGKIIIGGNFTTYNSIGRNRIARINSNCTLQSTYNPFPDTTIVCGSSSVLDAGSGYANFTWNNGNSSQILNMTSGGFYKVVVTATDGCQASDSTYVNLLSSSIINSDTVVCKSAQVTLNTRASSSGFAIDIDRNIYPTISIGNQIWFQRNLTTTKYRNGVLIPQITGVIAWAGNPPNTLGTGAWCWFNNDSVTYGSNYGKLYNWWTTINSNGLAPSGWHIPSNDELQELLVFLGGGSIAGGKLKSTGTNFWLAPNTGAVNSSGFSALPGSQRNYFGNFENVIGQAAFFWTTQELGTATPPGFGTTFAVYNTSQSVTISGIGKGSGQSVRPISDRRITYLWSTGATTSTISVSPTVTTTYYVTISDGISTCMDSVRVTVADVDTSVILLDPPQVCTNNGQVRLQAGIASSYQWLRNGVAISGATARLYTATQTGAYRVALVNSLGCRDTSRAVTVTLYPQPVSGFSVSPNTQCFAGNQFTFTNTTTLPSGTLSYLWDFGNGVTSTLQSPTYSYPAIGTYTVKLVATSSTGCKDSTITNITVNASPTAGFQVNNANQCLTGNNFIFTNSSLVNPGTLTYLWTFGDGNTSANTNPSHTYTAAGTYTVKLLVSSGSGCKDSVTRTVTVYPTPLGVLNPPSTNLLCEGGVVILTATGGTSYQWFLNGGAIAGATNATLSANQPGVYTVNVTSSNACTSTATGSVTLQLISKPTVNFTFTNYCATFPIQFNDQSNIANSGVVNYNWSFGQGQGTSTLQNPSYTYSSTGGYSVSLTVTPVACPSLSSTVTKPITTVAPPTSQRYTTLNAVQNRDLQLQARAFGAASYSWSPTSGLNNPSIFNPVFNFNAQVEFLITITTPIGCVVKDTQLVRIYKEKEIYVPKGFSPNGDGSNDKIFPRLVGIRTLLYFKIYDRWGQLIYQTSNENEGWDGRYRGVMQPIDTYVWIAEGVDIDNNNLKRTGTFMLLR